MSESVQPDPGSVRRCDPRFLLPELPGTAVVLGLSAWSDGLGELGVDVRVGASARRVDLVIAPSDRIAEALALEPGSLIVEGRPAGRSLRRAGFAAGTWLPLPGVESWEALLPMDARAPADFALTTWRPPVDPARALVGRAFAAAGQVPPRRRAITVASRDHRSSAVVRHAAAAGVLDPGARIFLAAPGVGSYGRLVAYAFSKGERQPSAIVKLARRPGSSGAFDADAHGLAIAARAGEVVQRHCPTLLARLDLQGYPASVESAAPGRPVSVILRSDGRRAGEVIDRIASWIVDVGVATAQPSETLAPERIRLETDVLPRFPSVAPTFIERLSSVPGVLLHDDIGTWNVLADRHDFGVVDWESARPSSFPLWDLCYFLADALALLDGARTDDDRVEGMLGLFRGIAPSSAVLFSWIRRARASLSLDPEAVAPLVLMGWMHHAASGSARPDGSAVPPAQRLAAAWLEDPQLGTGWSAWR